MPKLRSDCLWLLLATGSLLFVLVACSSPSASHRSPTPVVSSSPSVLPTASMTPSLGTTVYLTYTGHGRTVYGVPWSPDGTRLASADRTAQVWGAVTGKTLVTYSGHVGEVLAVAWSPDGRRIASGSTDGAVLVWDAATGRPLLTCRGQTSHINWLAWSPDGRHPASASSDSTVQVWNAATGRPLLTYRGHSNEVFGVTRSPDRAWPPLLPMARASPPAARMAPCRSGNRPRSKKGCGTVNRGESTLVLRAETASPPSTEAACNT